MTRKRHKTRYPSIWYRLVDEDRPDGPRRYIVRYDDANGAEHTETLPIGMTLEDARLRREALHRKKRHFVPTKMTVGELLDLYLDQRKSQLTPKTLEDYQYASEVVKKHMGLLRLKSLTASDIVSMTSSLKAEGKKTWTVKKILTPLSGALKVALREGWIDSNLMDTILPHERPKYDQRDMRTLSSEEITALLGAASTQRWRALFSLLVFTGLRIGEALNLRWVDVDPFEHRISVRQSKTEAGVREVMMIGAVWRPLAGLKLEQPVGTEYVFANGNGSPVSRREALRALRAAEKRAGLPNYTLHELRHTFASILIAQGETPVLVAHQMGHADPSTTLSTYAHLFDAAENVERARERLQEVFGGGLNA